MSGHHEHRDVGPTHHTTSVWAAACLAALQGGQARRAARSSKPQTPEPRPHSQKTALPDSRSQLGPQAVTTPPTVPNDGPACRVTVSQPAVGGQYYFPMTPHNFCVRKVQAQQCEVTTMQGLLRGDKLYNALQGPAFGMTDHAVQPVDTCTTGADSTIDLG